MTWHTSFDAVKKKPPSVNVCRNIAFSFPVNSIELARCSMLTFSLSNLAGGCLSLLDLLGCYDESSAPCLLWLDSDEESLELTPSCLLLDSVDSGVESCPFSSS